MIEKLLGKLVKKFLYQFSIINKNIYYLDVFEVSAFKEKELAEKVFWVYINIYTMCEKVGWQTQTCDKDPLNLPLCRAVLGPNLYFTAEGKVDHDPIHYWSGIAL